MTVVFMSDIVYWSLPSKVLSFLHKERVNRQKNAKRVPTTIIQSILFFPILSKLAEDHGREPVGIYFYGKVNNLTRPLPYRIVLRNAAHYIYRLKPY